MSTSQFPTFINNSGLPIRLETWQICDGIDSYEGVLVKAGEQCVSKSTTGEWILTTYLDKPLADEWRAAGIAPGDYVGKFRDKCSWSGEYSWMDDERFQIAYDVENRTATFTKKTELKN
jgi:hypothetical protein